MDSATSRQAKSAPRQGRWSRQLLVLCLAFIFVRLPFVFTVPMGEAPDEFAHFWVIRYMRDHLRLPSASEVVAGGPAAVYGSLPQMGYLPHLLVALVSPHDQLPLYERFGSMLAGLMLVYAAYHIGRELFPGNRLLQLALPVVIVFHPQLAFMQSYATSDATSSALSGLILLCIVRLIKSGLDVKRSSIIGLLLGWLILSKYSGVALIPAVALGFIASALINRTPMAEVVASSVSLAGISLLSCGWWFIRNAQEFHGDILGTTTMYRSWALTYHKDLNYYVPAWQIATELRWWRMMFFSYWGMFGYMTKYLWRPVYYMYLGYVLAAIAGVINACRPAQVAKASGAEIAPETSVLSQNTALLLPVCDHRDKWQAIASWSCLALVLFINLALIIWASTGNLGGPQGRYLFTSEIPVAALMVLGLHRLSGRYGNQVVLSFLLFNAAVCLGSWVMLFIAYGFHVRP